MEIFIYCSISKMNVLKHFVELPFRDNIVDVLVCDTPFGISHGCTEEVLNMYPSMLKEINR